MAVALLRWNCPLCQQQLLLASSCCSAAVLQTGQTWRHFVGHLLCWWLIAFLKRRRPSWKCTVCQSVSGSQAGSQAAGTPSSHQLSSLGNRFWRRPMAAWADQVADTRVPRCSSAARLYRAGSALHRSATYLPSFLLWEVANACQMTDFPGHQRQQSWWDSTYSTYLQWPEVSSLGRSVSVCRCVRVRWCARAERGIL